MARKILILGGGVGGTIIANLLAKKLEKNEAEITLVDKTGLHVYEPNFLYIAFKGKPSHGTIKEERKLLNPKVGLKIGEVKRIDPKDRTVEVGDEKLNYDYLVVATGARLVPEQIPGFNGNVHHFYTLDAALKLWDALGRFRGGKVVVSVGSVPSKCPAAPVEAACQLDYYFHRRGIRDKVEIEYLTPMSIPFPVKPIDPFMREVLREKQISYRTSFDVESVDPELRAIRSKEGEVVRYDLLVMIPPQRGAAMVEASGLGNGGGWIPTDPYTLKAKSFDDLYVIGDATDLPISKTGSTAHFESKVVAHNIASEIKGEDSFMRYNGRVYCYFDAGFRKGLKVEFTYDRPQPSTKKLITASYIAKQVFNRVYWLTIPTGLL